MSKKKEETQTAAETVENALTFVRRALMFWKRSLLTFVVVAIVGVPMVFLKARVYRSETIVLYQVKIRQEHLTGGETADNARRVGAHLKERLLSRASLEPIVKETPRWATLAERRGIVDATDELRSHITFRAREGDTFEIGYEGLKPEEAQDVTKRLAERVLQLSNEDAAVGTKGTKELLEQQSKQNKQKLDESQAQLSILLAQHPELKALLPPGSGLGGATTIVIAPTAVTPATPPPGTKDPVLYQMESEKAHLERRLRAGSGAAEPAPTAAAPREESQEVKDARKNYQEKLQSYTPQHPDVIAAKRQLDQAIANDAARAKTAPKPDAPAPSGKLSEAEREQIEARIRELRNQIARHVAEKKGLPPPPPVAGGSSATPKATASTPSAVALEVEFRRLFREVESFKENQRQLDEKLFKINLLGGAAESKEGNQVRILDPAYLPAHPSSKPRSTQLAMFLGIGLVLAALIAVGSAKMDDRIHAVEDLESLDLLPVVGEIPRDANAGAYRRKAA